MINPKEHEQEWRGQSPNRRKKYFPPFFSMDDQGINRTSQHHANRQTKSLPQRHKRTSKQEQILRRAKQTNDHHPPTKTEFGRKRKRKEQDKESTAHLRRGRGLPWPRRSRRRPPPPPRPPAGSTPRGGPARRRPSTRTRPAASGDSSPYCGQRPTAPSTRPSARPARG